jgi:hypothetical protein
MNSKLPLLTPLVIIIAIALVAERHRRSAAKGPDGSPKSIAVPATDGKNAAPIAQPAVVRREPPSAGDQLLMQAASQLERRASVSARLRHQVFVAGSSLYGAGSYWQQGMGDELRVRLELQIAGQEANLLQVSNSRFLWVERRLPTGRTVTRLDLRQLRADTLLGASPLEDIRPGNASWAAPQPELIAHYGGLPSLFVSLRENFSFLPPQPMRLAAGAESASLPVFAIVGHWRKEKLSALVPLHAPPSTLNSIPDRLPQEVLLLVGQGDLFPYRIEFRRLETAVPANVDAPPIPYQLSANPMVVLELTDVAFDAPIAAGQFDYAPGDAEWIDQTAALLERLHRERDQQLADRSNPQPPTARK